MSKSKDNGVVEPVETDAVEATDSGIRFDLKQLSVRDALDFQTRFAYAKRAEIMARVISAFPDTWDAAPQKMLQRFPVFKEAEAVLLEQMKAATIPPEQFVQMPGLSFVAYAYLNIHDVDSFFDRDAYKTAAALAAVVEELPDYLGSPAAVETYLEMTWSDFNHIQMAFIKYIGAYRKN